MYISDPYAILSILGKEQDAFEETAAFLEYVRSTAIIDTLCIIDRVFRPQIEQDHLRTWVGLRCWSVKYALSLAWFLASFLSAMQANIIRSSAK